MVEQQDTVLVVDNDQKISEMLSFRLRQAGYGVVEASCGQEALDLVQTGNVDLVLLDHYLPDIHGLEVLKMFRETYSVTRLPIIMVTGKSQSEDIVVALNLDANQYVARRIS